jgi:hypothetical protein
VVSSARIVYTSHPGITLEQASDTRACVWAFVFQCYESKKNPAAGQSVRGDSDGTKTKEDSAYAEIIPRA